MSRPATKKTYIAKLDDIVSRIVRSKGHCERCGCSSYEQLQCCHIYSRKNHSARWDFYNLMCLCAKCHTHFHDHPASLGDFVRTILKRDPDEIERKANEVKKWTLWDMQALYELLRTQFEAQVGQ